MDYNISRMLFAICIILFQVSEKRASVHSISLVLSPLSPLSALPCLLSLLLCVEAKLAAEAIYHDFARFLQKKRLPVVSHPCGNYITKRALLIN
jgi:hypothetical protein